MHCMASSFLEDPEWIINKIRKYFCFVLFEIFWGSKFKKNPSEDMEMCHQILQYVWHQMWFFDSESLLFIRDETAAGDQQLGLELDFGPLHPPQLSVFYKLLICAAFTRVHPAKLVSLIINCGHGVESCSTLIAKLLFYETKGKPRVFKCVIKAWIEF